jgi:hypothetical protein
MRQWSQQSVRGRLGRLMILWRVAGMSLADPFGDCNVIRFNTASGASVGRREIPSPFAVPFVGPQRGF